MEAKLPQDMDRAELLVYSNLLEQKVTFLNAEVRKCEANAVQSIAACVIAAGGEVRITKAIITQLDTAQFARTVDVNEDVVFAVRQKPVAPEVAPDAAPSADPVFYQDMNDPDDMDTMQRTPGWYFWQETWADTMGPYETEAAAREALKVYAEQL